MSSSAPAEADVRAPRQERSRHTRRRILEAAMRLFLRDGYAGATMAAIAAEAGVAVQSLYLRFGGKLEILTAALDVAIVGDDEPVALLDRPWFAELVAMRDGRAATRRLVAEVRRIMVRTQPLFAVVLSASGGETRGLLVRNKRHRREGLRAVAEVLAHKRGFTGEMSVDRAADELYALLSEESFGLLVGERGWRPEEWEAWCADLLCRSLFPATRRPARQ